MTTYTVDLWGTVIITADKKEDVEKEIKKIEKQTEINITQYEIVNTEK